MIKLKSLREIISEQLEKTTIFEMAYDRKKAEERIEGLGKQIFLHIVKLIRWEDPINHNKHIKDIDNWIYDIMQIDLKPNMKPVPSKDLYNWLFDAPFGSDRSIKIVIDKHLKKYHSLKLRNTNIEDGQYFYFLSSLYKKLSIDIENETFETIANYI